MTYQDHCVTAEDVLRNAAAVRARRRKDREPTKQPAKQPAKTTTLEPAKPQNVPDTAFEALVAAAYPADYASVTLPQLRTVGIRDIQNAVCAAFNIGLCDLASNRRFPLYVRARQLAFSLCKRFTSRSYPEIGRLFGRKDHATVLYGAKKAQPIVDAAAKILPADATLTAWANEVFRLSENHPELWPAAYSIKPYQLRGRRGAAQ